MAEIGKVMADIEVGFILINFQLVLFNVGTSMMHAIGLSYFM